MNTQALSSVHASPVDATSAPSLKPRLERLTAALVDSESRLACIRRNNNDQARIGVCERLLREIRSAIESMPAWHADEREFFAWDCVGQFDRQMVYLVDERERQAIWLCAIHEAGEKLGGHRKKAVERLIESVGDGAAPAATVEAALKQIQAQSQNQYYRIAQLRRQIFYVGLFLLVMIVGVVVAARMHWLERLWPNLDQTLELGMLLGLVGGVLSLAFTVSRTDETAKIPKVRMSFQVALARPIIGAALALPVVLIVDSGLITVAGVEKKWLVAIASFLAGFSERWFLGIMEGLEKKARVGSSEDKDGKH